MTAAAPVAPSDIVAGRAGTADRFFFTSYTVAVAIVLFLGFAPSFYLRGIVPPYHPLKPMRAELVAHGLLATCFVLAFPIQAFLIALGKRRLHMGFGKWVFGVGALMVPLTYLVGASGYRLAPPSVAPIAAALSVPTVPVLTLLLILGWRLRADADAHKRAMLVLAALLTDPAFNRLPLWPSTMSGLLMSQGAVVAMTAPLWIWDLVTRGKPHWMTVTGSLLLLVLIVGRTLIWSTGEWASFLKMLPGFG